MGLALLAVAVEQALGGGALEGGVGAQGGDHLLDGAQGALQALDEADASALGGALIPGMTKRYGNRNFAAAVEPVAAVEDDDAPVTYQEFVKAGKKEGKNIAQIAALWQQHKIDSAMVAV